MKARNEIKRRRALIIIPALLIVLIGCFLILPLFESPEINSVAGSADWMKNIPDSTPLNMIALPGTHDSAAEYVFPAFFARCQSRSISEQLNDGFRYLDIRLGVESGNDKVALDLMHGSAFCRKKLSPSSGKLRLDSVLAQCYAFLDLHPHETVVFTVSRENGDESVSSFENLLNSYVSQDPEYWLLTDAIPTLGEARGKLVLMRRYPDAAGLGTASGIPAYWEDQSGFDDPDLNYERCVAENITLWVQDRYEFDSSEKWLAFLTTLGTCPADYDRGELCINFLSTKGTLTYGHPYGYAKTLNGQLSALAEKSGSPNGWIILDFGTPELAQRIYSANFES